MSTLHKKIKKLPTKTRLRISVGIFLLAILAIAISLPQRFEPDSVRFSDHEIAGEAMPVGGPYFYTEQALDREINSILLSPAQFTLLWRRAQRFGPDIRAQLRDAGLPEDLFYVAMVESALRERVYSSAGAAGLRQFMPETARRFGLRVDDEIDERMNRKAATTAAIQYFQILHDRFDNRTLAIAAYNRGENGLTRDLQRQFTDNFYDSRLNPETRRYIFRVLAMKHLMENTEKYFSAEELGQGYEHPIVQEITVRGPIPNLAERAASEWRILPEIKTLNPRIVWRSIPEGTRTLHVARFRE